MNSDDYHSDFSRDSNSSLLLFSKNVARYAGIRIYKSIKPEPPTQEMILGSAFHCAVFEREKFQEYYAVFPKCDLRTKDGKEAMLAFRKINAGRTILTWEQAKVCHDMAASILTHVDANDLIAAESLIPNESVIEWNDEETGLPLKAKIDKLTVDQIIDDMKTSSDASQREFEKSCWQYGYHRQAALYREGLRIAKGIEAEFVFTVVESSPPHYVEVYEPDEEMLALGHEENHEAIRDLARRKRENDWSSIKKLSLPKWARK